MKKLLLLFVISVFAFKANAQIETYGRFPIGEKPSINLNIFGDKRISEKFSIIGFGMIEQESEKKTWGQALIGISYKPKEWIKCDLRGGLESSPELYRFGASIFLENEDTIPLKEKKFIQRISSENIFEIGGGKNNYFYKNLLLYRATKNFYPGVIAWRYHGVGAYIQFRLFRSMYVFTSVLYNTDTKNIVNATGFKITW